MNAPTLDAIRSHLSRLCESAAALDERLSESAGLLTQVDGERLARELDRLAVRLEGLAEAVGYSLVR